ncbi:MAG: hypothetical protein A3G32_02710 [Deltaproteobacteria bacterium RIFCSPLOWO2_12_FULL_40_28]|nr:MAG: hypothetical protein A3C45_00090 [Deltaproteobacteria bacterium RIFCSPHIGHO2_02_FULL_40_28]OGQ20029.1 MAG: hypothetical protein A3E27_02755 [Deltaproteobacteria bacterium RIFCSPHIGHO2_12_FULL_40_32]OGQ40596.1 MAG: hypothetical protein A3I69_10180 [Deltaproteobacteria bacterium RIFCSPLOWO2_02_FULL_40_36]OGQ54265.1 MAG: hypothetical protein A3G32_02710 [Deltaproteobacteria bacterium RIFCSPLOWO2_12_FULL_40_28]
MRSFVLIFIFFFCLTACQNTGFVFDSEPGSDDDVPDTNESPTPLNPIDPTTSSVSLLSLNLEQEGEVFILEVGQTQDLSFQVQFSDGTIENSITSILNWPNGSTETILWQSDNTTVASVDQGRVTALHEGVALIGASVGEKNILVDFVVNPQTSSEKTLTQLSFYQDSYSQTSSRSFLITLDGSYSDQTSFSNQYADNVSLRLGCSLLLSSSRPAVAEITQAGAVIPKANGATNLIAACGSVQTLSVLTISGLDVDAPFAGTETLESLAIVGLEDEQTSGSEASLFCDVTFNGGTVSNASGDFVSPGGQIYSIIWSSSDESIFSIDENTVNFLVYGEATLQAEVDGMSTTQEIAVKMSTEWAATSTDYFLSSNDEFTLTEETNGGYGSYPNALYGAPWTGGTDVVSLGGGGSILIHLQDYVVVDGVGVDFTVFENPVLADVLFAERARVLVSENGTDFFEFSCDEWNTAENYPGCAGVNPVNALASPFNPSISGGDSFDLADVGLTSVSYILIEDLNTCVEGDPTYPLCGVSYTQGFDLDSLVIINGQQE